MYVDGLPTEHIQYMRELLQVVSAFLHHSITVVPERAVCSRIVGALHTNLQTCTTQDLLVAEANSSLIVYIWDLCTLLSTHVIPNSGAGS